MDLEADEIRDLPGPRTRTFSNVSQHSQHSFKQNFPLLTSDSGLYTFSSNTSDCSLQNESDTDSRTRQFKVSGFMDERLRLALHDVRKLRSELERLTKSEQWYKHELKQQKTTRLEDLERIYSQERKFMKENQRLQKECVRLYEKCNELEMELEKQRHETSERHIHQINDEDGVEDNMLPFVNEQQVSLINDQQQLICVLRKQKRSLLEDLRCLTKEKDEKVVELQRLLADLELDNKRITKKCKQYVKERIKLENNLKQSDSKLSAAMQETMNLEKSIIDLREQLKIQQQLLILKESEIENIQQHYTHKIRNEQDLDEVHKLSIKYQEEVNIKSLEIITLKERLHELELEMEEMQSLQQQNDLQQRQIDQLNFTIETYRLELEEFKASDEQKNRQLYDLQISIDKMFKEKEIMYKSNIEQQNDLFRVKKTLKATKEQYEQVQDLYKKTQFQLELLEIEQGKVKFENEQNVMEIEHLRHKLREYLKQTKDLSNKIQLLEEELKIISKENSELKQNTQELKKVVQELKENGVKVNEKQNMFKDIIKSSKEASIQVSFDTPSSSECVTKPGKDQDFLQLQQQFNKLQQKIDFITNFQVQSQDDADTHTEPFPLNTINAYQSDEGRGLIKLSSFTENLESDQDILKLSLESKKLQQSLDKLYNFFKGKPLLLNHLNNLEQSNEGMENLVIENEILKKKLCETQTEACTLQIKQDINERSQKYTQMKDNLNKQTAKVEYLQENLLKNNAKLYKLEKKLKLLNKYDEKLEDIQKENTRLREQMRQEEDNKADLNRKLLQETNKMNELRRNLEGIITKQKPTKNQIIQCVLIEDSKDTCIDIKELKQHVQQRDFLKQEAHKKEERIQLLYKMMDLQNSKMQNLQQHQHDYEEMLTSLNEAHVLEERTRKELELKRMELEELNKVFAEQNEELRKLEEFTALLDMKRQQEKEHLKQTFQQEINVMKRHLQDCQQEIEKQKLINEQLEKRNEKFELGVTEDYSSEVAGYKKEIRELKSRVNRIMEEKEDLLEHLKETEKQVKDLKESKRGAIFMPNLTLISKATDVTLENSIENVEALKHSISEDHLRILTKVLESEYQRKMQRYDEHIHSLLINLKTLKKSLKVNEEKVTLLSEELKDLRNSKRSLEEMRLKYEQSQNFIKELKESLAFERKKFELSDIGKSSQSIGNTYEVSNLIDDYKKLIQQSAITTKRPTTSAILDLIQHSDQCVPNLQKLETNVDGLRSELQNFLALFNHKMPASSLIAPDSLSVPPSLMDELKAEAALNSFP